MADYYEDLMSTLAERKGGYFPQEKLASLVGEFSALKVGIRSCYLVCFFYLDDFVLTKIMRSRHD